MERRERKGRILIVERDIFTRETIRRALEEEYELFFTDSGLEAMRLAKELEPDLIIIEPLIPGMDGFQLCLYLKGEEETRDTPILLLSMLSAKERAEQVGADGFMLKPVNKAELREKVEKLLRSNRNK